MYEIEKNTLIHNNSRELGETEAENENTERQNVIEGEGADESPDVLFAHTWQEGEADNTRAIVRAGERLQQAERLAQDFGLTPEELEVAKEKIDFQKRQSEIGKKREAVVGRWKAAMAAIMLLVAAPAYAENTPDESGAGQEHAISLTQSRVIQMKDSPEVTLQGDDQRLDVHTERITSPYEHGSETALQEKQDVVTHEEGYAHFSDRDLREMNALAEKESNEYVLLYVSNGENSPVLKVRSEQRRGATSASVSSLENLMKENKNEKVFDLHTHPLFDNVRYSPPSPSDLLSSAQLDQYLIEDGLDPSRLREGAIDSGGVWEYGFAENSRMPKKIVAYMADLDRFSETYPQVAEWIRTGMDPIRIEEELKQAPGGYPADAQEIIRDVRGLTNKHPDVVQVMSQYMRMARALMSVDSQDGSHYPKQEIAGLEQWAGQNGINLRYTLFPKSMNESDVSK